MDCNKHIVTLIKSRMEKGKKQYGHGLLQDSGYDWVQEALEEALDLSIYISAKLVEVKIEQARKIWGDALTNEELLEWIEMKNERSKNCTLDKEGKGETISLLSE